MSLAQWLPPAESPHLRRNGYALLPDLDTPQHAALLHSMEGFQATFLAMTRPIWRSAFSFTGDVLYNFSRQWEYPYVWSNLPAPCGRLLDAGSGITFFPYLLSVRGWEVDCCDTDGSLEPEFNSARHLTGLSVRFTKGSIASLPYDDAVFDAVVCISVLEHMGSARANAIQEFARVLRPDGRLVLTCDLSLSRDADTNLEDLSVLLLELDKYFKLTHQLSLHRPRHLLTSDCFLEREPWRLPWRAQPGIRGLLRRVVAGRPFRSIAILGITAERLNSVDPHMRLAK